MAEITALDCPGGCGLDGDGESEGGEDEQAAESGHVWLVVSAEIISFVRKAAQLEEGGRQSHVSIQVATSEKLRLTSLGESERRKWGVARGEAKTSWRAGVDRAGHIYAHRGGLEIFGSGLCVAHPCTASDETHGWTRRRVPRSKRRAEPP